MKIDITAALNMPGTPISFNKSNKIKVIDIAGEDFIVKGSVEVSYKALCNRCMKPLSRDLAFEFHEEYTKIEDDDCPERYLFENSEIDLKEMVLNNISLNMPMKHVCCEDCRGLCPVCGGDLNVKDCSCIEEEKMKSSPFAKIKELSLEED